MKKFNIIITAYLSILAFNSTYCSDMTLVKESTVLDSLEAEIIDQIQKLKANGINATDSQGRTPLFIAAQYNQVQIIKELLLNKDVEIDKADNDGLTPLAIAINEGHIEAVQALLDSNSYELYMTARFFRRPINVETRDKRIGYSPLARAALSGHGGIIKLLLQAGANPTAVVTIGDKTISASELYKADDKAVADLMKDKVREYTMRGLEFITALIKYKKLEDVERINVNTKGEYGYTPLHLIALYGHKDIVRLLIDSKANINAKNLYGSTPLHEAAFADHKNIVKQLIDSKADVNAKNNNGNTPLHETLHETAFKVNKDIIVEMLKKAGAKDQQRCIVC